MFPFFGKRKRKERPIRRAAASWVMARVIRVQKRIADRLSARTAGWSRQQQKRFLVIFCFLFGGTTALFSVHSFRQAGTGASALKPDPISVPSLKPISSTPAKKKALIRDLSQVRQYRRTLDSLSRDSASAEGYKEFISSRHGLLDSLATLENHLQSLIKEQQR